MTQEAVLSLGSNLGNREGNLRAALQRLAAAVRVTSVSSVYESEPVGVTDQPAFLNLVVVAQANQSPGDLLSVVKEIERAVGRVPTFRWGPRVVDVDILVYGDQIIDLPNLVIPHAEMTNRAFVLVPLAEIRPGLLHPTLGRTVEDLLAEVPGRDTVRLYQSPKRSSDNGSPRLW